MDMFQVIYKNPVIMYFVLYDEKNTSIICYVIDKKDSVSVQ